jgi:hypothetical protein
MTRRDRWQLISSDEVWMFPADIQLSTVELPREFYPDTPYESCLFFANGDSDVVARYATQQEAIEGHMELEKKYKLKRCSKLKI